MVTKNASAMSFKVAANYLLPLIKLNLNEHNIKDLYFSMAAERCY